MRRRRSQMLDDDVGGVDLFDAAPLALDYDDVVDADGFGEMAIWRPARKLDAVDLAAVARMREATPAEARSPEP